MTLNMMDKVKILVACHKQATTYQDKTYMPIQVGKALHRSLDLGFVTDDNGNNISKDNLYYSELTALYWGWKNLNCEYIGLNHYRRYFNFIFNEDNIDNFFKDCDIVLASPLFLPQSIFDFWQKELIPEDVYIALKLLKAMYPDDYKKGQQFFSNNIFYPCNMFICKKELCDSFASWEFKYLEELKKLIKFSYYSREKRILGFIGEALLPLYFFNRNYKVRTLDVVSYPNKGELILKSSKINKLKAIIKKNIKKNHIQYNNTILGGLRQDCILDNNNDIIR